MTNLKYKIREKGVYLVINPLQEKTELLTKIKIALEAPLVALQILDSAASIAAELILEICHLARAKKVPVIINNRYEFLQSFPLDGVHFDTMPDNYAAVKKVIGTEAIIGLTCGNDLATVREAHRNRLDYISFCSMFFSRTQNSCMLVDTAIVKKARKITDMPIFLAGGITTDNLPSLKNIDFTGIAVVSEIMNHPKPDEKIIAYLNQLSHIL